MIATVVGWGRSVSLERAHRGGRVLGVVMLVYYAIEGVVRVKWIGTPIASLWPFEICNILFFLAPLAFWLNRPLLYAIVYLWTFSATFHALVTPTPGTGFPSIEYVRYFFAHGLLILAAAYSLVALGQRPTGRNALLALAALQGFEILVGVIDWLSGENYLYLRAPPPSPTLYDALGPWPWYHLSIEVIAFVSFYVWYRVAIAISTGPLGRKVSAGAGAG